jgi:hypothetical protein
MSELVPTEMRVSPAPSERHDVLCRRRGFSLTSRSDGWAPSKSLKHEGPRGLVGPSKEGEDPNFLHEEIIFERRNLV